MSALRILLAGDDLATRETLRAFLLRAGYAVTSAAGGREAIDAFRLERADVVMLDVAMPRGRRDCRRERDPLAGRGALGAVDSSRRPHR